MLDHSYIGATDDVAPSGFARMFRPGQMTLGVTFAIEAYEGDTPRMDVAEQITLAQRAEALGFAALWFRDVPLRDPAFGDVGQVFDPWVWMGVIAAETQTITLATGSIILPLRSSIDTAKAAASIDHISQERLVLGVASGDRPVEYPAYGVDPNARGDLFRDRFSDLRRLWGEEYPEIRHADRHLRGGDLLPKPRRRNLPLLVTGSSRQSLDWIAAHADGWLTYPRPLTQQAATVAQWNEAVARTSHDGVKPVAQSLYIDLLENPHATPKPIHLGWQLGRSSLIDILHELSDVGIGHVFFNLKYSQRPANEVLEELGSEVIPFFKGADISHPVGVG